MKKMQNLWPLIISAVMGCATTSSAIAEEGTVKILAPWESEGQVYWIGPDTIMFQGAAEGIMYIERGEGSLDTAEIVCPGTNVIDAKKKTTKASGHCIISGADEGDVVFAEYECKGKPGGCKGKFTITGGTGKFEGITGSGEMLVRTALLNLVANLDSGSLIQDAAGLAVWPKLRYKIPEKK